MHALSAVNDGITMSSWDFLNNIINPARAAANESPLRNTELVRKIEDECDNLGVMQIFYATTSQGASREVSGYMLNMDQMMLVGMRESKSVRRSVLAKLKDLSSGQIQHNQIHDPALLRIAEAKRLGLMTAEQAHIAARDAILGSSQRSERKRVPSPQEQEKPWRRAEPSGANRWNLHGGLVLPLDELHHWVKGGKRELYRALLDGGFIDERDKPTNKGARLFAGERKGRVLAKAQQTLTAIGAW